MHTQQTQQIHRLNELIQGIDNVMFTTINPDGAVNSRPMLVQDTPFDGTLWFFTHRSSGKVDAIAEDNSVNIAFMDPRTNRFISMSGQAHIVEDQLLMQKMWTPHFDQWFSGGAADPDLVLIRVQVTHAEYWDTPHADVVESFTLTDPDFKTRPCGTSLSPDHHFHSL